MKPKRLAVLAVGLLAVTLAAAPAFAGRVEALFARSQAAEAKGKLGDAVLLAQAAVVADPARATSYVSLADLYARHREFHNAWKYYGEALGIDPTLASALAGAGKAGLALGDRKGAESFLTRLEKSCGAECKETRELAATLKTSQKSQPDSKAASLDKR
ncbi:MAG: hypothetical protein KGJ75_06875 [Alphaproteobacteria bacterium]|nr:hypothetical protein [Alphaproteobacteria bacterium]MDE2072111.1 hypothetical protein [Alphaproteobacteria bacterium]